MSVTQCMEVWLAGGSWPGFNPVSVSVTPDDLTSIREVTGSFSIIAVPLFSFHVTSLAWQTCYESLFIHSSSALNRNKSIGSHYSLYVSSSACAGYYRAVVSLSDRFKHQENLITNEAHSIEIWKQTIKHHYSWRCNEHLNRLMAWRNVAFLLHILSVPLTVQSVIYWLMNFQTTFLMSSYRNT